MPIQAVVTSLPSLPTQPSLLPAEVRPWVADLTGPNASKCWWVVSTKARARQINQQPMLSSGMRPRVFTLDDLLNHLAAFSLDQRPVLGNTGRILTVARAYKSAFPDKSNPTPGRLAQLDESIAEWRDANAAPPAKHPLSAVFKEFVVLLKKDARTDRAGWIMALAKEIADGRSPLAGLVGKTHRIVFDGYHRFSGLERQLIAALGSLTTVRLWLVGDPGQSFHANLAAIVKELKVEPVHVSRNPPILASIGEAIFHQTTSAKRQAAVEIHEVSNIVVEAETVARRVKQLKKTWGAKGRLADIAVVVPNDNYVASLTSIFAASGIACSPSAERFPLAQSRPARLLLAALRIVNQHWPASALFDFLRQPLILRRLEPGFRLDQLQRLSPVENLGRDWPKWQTIWNLAIERFASAQGDEEGERDEDPEKRQKTANELRVLVESIGTVLEPVRKLQEEIGDDSNQRFAYMARAVARLLDAVKMNEWLSPTKKSDWLLVSAREWEIDQLAFNNLKDVLRELADSPFAAIDAESVLRMALEAEQFRTRADDDAGVQIVRPGAIRGLTFKAIFAMGLVEGTVPSLPRDLGLEGEANELATRNRQERQHEEEYLFTQLFEAASERVILTRPRREGEAELMESPFLRRLKEVVEAEPVDSSTTIIDRPRAMLQADRLTKKQKTELEPLFAARSVWDQSRQKHRDLRIRPWAMPLLKLRYPPERSFSATALERYATCPFQHFATKTLGLDELERDDRPWRAGLFVHQVLEDFHEQSKGKPFQAEPARELLFTIFHEKWIKYGPLLDPSWHHDFRVFLGQIFLGLSAKLQEKGFEQVEAEWEFKDLEIKDETGRSIRLFGQIDRIDRATIDGHEVELIADYKTGDVKSGGKLESRLANGRSLQLPLYGLARQLSEKIDVKHGLYVRLSRRADPSTPDDPVDFLEQVGELFSTKKRFKPKFEPIVAGNLAVRLAHDMLDGRMPLTTFDIDSKDSACTGYCAARHACRQPKGYK